MKQSIYSFGQCLFVGALLASHVSVAEPVSYDGVVAVVGSSIITMSEIEDSKLILQSDPSLSDEERENMNNAALQRMIEDNVISQAAAKEGLWVDDNEVQRSIDGWLAQNQADQTALLAELSRQGITWEDYQSNMRKHLLQSKFIDYMIHPKVNITEAQIREYYAQEVGAIRQESAAKVWIIFMPIDADNSAGTVADLAGEVRAKIISGDSFADLAKTYSRHPSSEDGGLLGTFKSGELFGILDEAAFNPDSLVVSQPLSTDQGVFLMRAEPTAGEDTLGYDEAKPKIEGFLYQKELQRQLELWIEDAKRNTHIEILDTEISQG